MPKYWIIAPVQADPPERFDKVWQFDLANNLISIGWAELGNVSKMNWEELDAAIASTYPEKPPGARGLLRNMIRAFYQEIRPDDLVIARRGRRILAAVGKVIRPAVYSPGKNPNIGHPNFLEVAWQERPRDLEFSTMVFPRYTLDEMSDEQFQMFVKGGDGKSSDEVTVDPEKIEDPNAFVLEKYLEDFIVSNFEAIFQGRIKLYVDSEGNYGQQYTTEVGPIDILAFEPKSNSFVVIELKKGRPSDHVIGQTLRYMGWVKRNLCGEGQVVKGLVICRDQDTKLSYALEMIKDIEVRYYTVSFKLTETPYARRPSDLSSGSSE